MVTKIMAFLLVAVPVLPLFAQSTNVPVEIQGSSAAAIADELKREEARRAEARKDIETDLQTKEAELTRLKAEEEEETTVVPRLEKELEEAQAKLDSAYTEMSRVQDEYNQLARQEKENLSRQLVADLSEKYRQEHSQQLASYKRDRELIENYKWKISDFDDLVLKIPDDKGVERKLVFSNQRNVSGEFPTMDIQSGRVKWHRVPPQARLSVVMVSGNPFVADVTLMPGFSVAEYDSTNKTARFVHVFIVKHFDEERRDTESRYELAAVSWFPSSEKPVCWQMAELPVMNPTPEPELEPAIASAFTPQIASVLDGWVWKSKEWDEKAADFRSAYEQAKTELKNKESALPKARAKANNQLAINDLKQKEIETEIVELKKILAEYQKEDQTDDFDSDFDENPGTGNKDEPNKDESKKDEPDSGDSELSF